MEHPIKDCEYPFNPNAAGLRWIDLVKNEWNSTQTISKTEIGKIRNIYFGEYDAYLYSADGTEIGTSQIVLSKRGEMFLVLQNFEIRQNVSVYHFGYNLFTNFG